MNRREMLKWGGLISVSGLVLRSLSSTVSWAQAPAGGAKKLTEKDILKEGEPVNIANYCVNPEKQPNKFCKDYKKPAHCATCTFYNKDNSETDYKGGKYARCMLLADPKKAQFVAAKAWCSTYAPKT